MNLNAPIAPHAPALSTEPATPADIIPSARLLQAACVAVAPLLTREGLEAADEASVRAVCEVLACLSGEAVAPPSDAARRALGRDVLVAGLPLAALPVESLHKPWCGPDGTVRAARGLYGGESARHARALYAACGLSVPEGFAAMPDHLALLLELEAFFLEADDASAARTLVCDHFDWLGAYDAMLAARAEQAADAPAFDMTKRRDLAQGIAFMRTMVRSMDRAVHAWAANAA